MTLSKWCGRKSLDLFDLGHSGESRNLYLLQNTGFRLSPEWRLLGTASMTPHPVNSPPNVWPLPASPSAKVMVFPVSTPSL
jgi:hypothetical protein